MANILIVDDDSLVRRALRRMLEDDGHVVWDRADPTEAIVLVTRDQKAFDLVITDYNMPQMTGSQMARRLRYAYDYKRPILCLTAQYLDPVEHPDLTDIERKPLRNILMFLLKVRRLAAQP